MDHGHPAHCPARFFFHAARVSARRALALNLPWQSSSMPSAYAVRPARSVCGRRSLSRHFWTAEGRIPNLLPNFVRPIWSIALATVLLMAPSLHRKWKIRIDLECKRLVSHFTDGQAARRVLLGQARGIEPGRRLAFRFVGYRARARHLALRCSEVAGWRDAAWPEEHDCARDDSWRKYGMAKDGPWPKAV